MNQIQLLQEIGSRVRSTRNQTGWTLREVAERSGVSPRFLSDLEAGRGNISVSRLADVSRALGTALSKLLPPDTGNGSSIERVMGLVDRCSDEDLEELTAWLGKRFKERPDPLVMLVGLRGAGKSTVGSTLAKLLEVPFVELDALIEEEANLSLSELFSLHGGELLQAARSRHPAATVGQERADDRGDRRLGRHGSGKLVAIETPHAYGMAQGHSGRSLETGSRAR